MKRSACFLVLILLYLQNECYGSPTKKGMQWVFSYKGNIDTKTSACNKPLARWTVSGKLKVQSFEYYTILKLDDLKTSVYNGDSEKTHIAEEIEIPEDTKVLLQPFVVHKDSKNILSIDFIPDEPLWSINMKRAIASNFQIQLDVVLNVDSATLPLPERSIYGNCEVEYLVKGSKEEIIITKIIDHSSCSEKSRKHRSNVRKPRIAKYIDPLQRKTIRKYILKEVNNVQIIHDIYSTSNITHKSMPQVPSTQHIDQHQEFKLLSSSLVDTIIDKSKITDKKDIIYEFGQDATNNGRHIYDSDANKLTKQFLDNYNIFNEKLNTLPLKHYNVRDKDHVESMYLSLLDMKEDGPEKLKEELSNLTSYTETTVLLSLLPYVGTNHTTKFIANLLKHDNFASNEFLGIKLLGTFPTYIDYPTEELLENLEFMLNASFISNGPLKNAAVLSFASVISTSIKRGLISDAKLNKYRNIFYDNYISNINYEHRMIHLLGLINIAKGLDFEFILPILTNTSESNHLRALAITGFKPYVLLKPNKVYNNFWPIVQNKTESFDIRVAALDLLLSVKLSEQQFNSILEVYKHKQDDIHDKHLFYYFVTTLQSIQNVTGYYDPLGSLASSALEKEKFAHFAAYAPSWTTGNYRLSYTDAEPNLGGYLHTRLVANPLKNAITTIQLTFNQFMMSFDLGTYSLYVKLDGVPEYFYKKKFLSKIADLSPSLPELLDILRDDSFKITDENIEYHAEIVVFVENRVVFAMHINPGNVMQQREYLETIAEVVDITDRNTTLISYPLMDYTSLPSDLGTTIKLINDIQDIKAFSSVHNSFKYRFSWYFQTWFESYNPIADTSIASYKYYGEEKSLNGSMSLNFHRLVVAWAQWNDSFNYVSDKLIGTALIEDNVPKRYCPKCDQFYEIDANNVLATREKSWKFIGANTSATTIEHTNVRNENDVIVDYVNLQRTNADSFQLAKIGLLYWYIYNDKFYLRNELRSVSVKSVPYYGEPTMSLINLDVNDDLPVDYDPLYKSVYRQFSIEGKTTKLDDEDHIFNQWETSYRSIIKRVKDNSKPIVEQNQTFNIDFISPGENRFKLCYNRITKFPGLISDQYSILSPEPTIAQTKIIFGEVPVNETVNDQTCGNTTMIFNETFSTSEEQSNKARTMKEYLECKEESTGKLFTVASEACYNVRLTQSQYDNYETYAKIEEETPEMNITDMTNSPIFQLSRVGDNKLALALLKSPFNLRHDGWPEKYYNYTVYYPNNLVDPMTIAYNNYDVIGGMKKSCIITPKVIKTFTGSILNTNESKSVAFIECFKKSLRGMTFKQLNDNKIGFKLWSQYNTLTATVIEDKIEVKLNDNILEDTYDGPDKKFRVHFFDKNVIYVFDDDVEIYYNTEHIYVKIDNLYSTVLSGSCM